MPKPPSWTMRAIPATELTEQGAFVLEADDYRPRRQVGIIYKAADQQEIARRWNCCPELLTALKDLVRQIENAAAHGIDTTGYIGVGDACAAIRKAEGRQ